MDVVDHSPASDADGTPSPTHQPDRTRVDPHTGGLDAQQHDAQQPDTEQHDADRLDLDRIERDLADVETALERLEAGTYWTDEVTGEPIPDAVLVADPLRRRAS